LAEVAGLAQPPAGESRPYNKSRMPTSLRSHAKINLGLYIGTPRPDGYHSLVTVYQTLEMHDVVTVSARRAGKTVLRLTSNDRRVPVDARNTAWKMIFLALEELGISADVEIHIEKRLPVQGGLGAGSANAVAALVGLEKELGIERRLVSESAGQQVSELPEKMLTEDACGGWARRRLEIAAKVGSDVPLFLVGGAVLGEDRGQRVTALPDFQRLWCLVAAPERGVSTPQAFRDWDELCAEEGLTDEASASKLNRLSHDYLSAFGVSIPGSAEAAGSSGVLAKGGDRAGQRESELVRTGITSWIENDFERVVFRQQPPLAEIKQLLWAPGTPEAATYAALSGSGSALFGLFRSRDDAEAALKRVLTRETAGLRCVLTQTLPRAEYWRGMLMRSSE